MALVPIVGIGLGAYLTYRALTYYLDDPTDVSHKKYGKTMEFHPDDELTYDVHADMQMGPEIAVKHIDDKLYNVDLGYGGYIQVDDKKLDQIIKDNNRQTKVIWIK